MAARALRSVMPNGHQRKPSSKNRRDDPALQGLHDEHPSVADPMYLKEGNGNRNASRSPKKIKDLLQDENAAPSLRPKRSASFKSILDREKSGLASRETEKQDKPLKKSKSSTSLSALLTRSRSGRESKKSAETDIRDKENQCPSTDQADPPPIWAQFATQEAAAPIKVPLNDVWIAESHRPFSDKALPKAPSPNLAKEHDQRPSGTDSTDSKGKRRSRVQAAVAAINGISQVAIAGSDKECSSPLDPQAVENAFEALLSTRNVPENTKDKMRSLDTNIKADLVRQEKASSRSGTSGGLSQVDTEDTPARSRPQSCGRRDDETESMQTGSSKKSRPRSLTFSFSKGDLSPSKKAKSESHQRTKSSDAPRMASSRSSSQTNLVSALGGAGKVDKTCTPEHFIQYLRKIKQPQAVEVGKIQKLRQLLRNEAVTWVETFVDQRGIPEVLGLLYRTIEVEWREEHEDNVLHELLLCLKALSTTSSALNELSAVQSCLFPKLIGMLFDKEKKGPSEYSTRTLIIVLLSNYLAYSRSSSFEERAKSLLSHLRDPSPPEEAQLPGFITSIYHPRPFRVWNKELDNLTKEVFWIFLHHTNIIPFPPEHSAPAAMDSGDVSSYRARHFPREHPPVPAAPYIGGVEWEATTYVTAHLDLINGIIASLPSRDDRNAVRQQLKDSGFEKLMGGYLRTCKEKFYGSVHEALSVWIGAAREDGWAYKDVKEGPPREEMVKRSPQKSGGGGGGKNKGGKKAGEQAAPPRLEMPKLDLGAPKAAEVDSGGWF